MRSRPQTMGTCVLWYVLAFWRSISDPTGPAHPNACIQPPNSMAATNQCLALASCCHLSPWCMASVLDKDQSWALKPSPRCVPPEQLKSSWAKTSLTSGIS